MEKKVFRSRISVLLLVFISLIMLQPLVTKISSGNIFNSEFYIMVGAILFIILLLCGLGYTISGNKLSFKIFWVIPLRSVDIKDIFSVKRSYNPISSPSASLKRLKIEGFGFPIFISPVREQEFLDTLKICNPKIDIQVNYKKGWWRIWDLDI